MNACRCLPLVAGMLLASGVPVSAEILAGGRYSITARIVMPHLEENLRYATVYERRCLRQDEAGSLFPVLRNQTLTGCRLEFAETIGETIRYQLRCNTEQVATGNARLDSGGGRVRGILNVKMGGKNMTFSQHVEAIHESDCAEPR
jgi:hypothetical protein